MFTHDPFSIRPKRGWAIIRQDRRKTVLSSGLVLLAETNAEKLHEGSGVIIRLGRGPRVEASGLVEGDRVMYRTYLRHAVPIESGLFWPSQGNSEQQAQEDLQKMEFFFMSIDDINAVIGPDIQVGAISERKATP